MEPEKLKGFEGDYDIFDSVEAVPTKNVRSPIDPKVKKSRRKTTAKSRRHNRR